jgi:hypothetical protein
MLYSRSQNTALVCGGQDRTRRARRGARHVAGIERLTVGAPRAGRDAGAARHVPGIEGLAAECRA